MKVLDLCKFNEGRKPKVLTVADKMKLALEHLKTALMGGDVNGFTEAMGEIGYAFTDNPETVRKMSYKLELVTTDPPHVYKKDSGTYNMKDNDVKTVEYFGKYINEEGIYYKEHSYYEYAKYSTLRITCCDDYDKCYIMDTGKIFHESGAEKTFFDKLEEAGMKAVENHERIAKRINGFSEATLEKYGMNNVTDYVSWVAEYIPVILKANNQEKIDIGECKCGFWSGYLKKLDDQGIWYWIGGDSTDDDGYIQFNQWKQRSTFKEYHSYCGATCEIDYDDKKNFSKKIYDYILELLKNGNIE